MLSRHQNTSDLLRHIARHGALSKSLKKIDSGLRNEFMFTVSTDNQQSAFEMRNTERPQINAGESLKNQSLNCLNNQVTDVTRQIRQDHQGLKLLNYDQVEPNSALLKQSSDLIGKYQISQLEKPSLSMQQTSVTSDFTKSQKVVQYNDDQLNEKSLQLSQQQSSSIQQDSNDNLQLLSKKRSRQGKTPAAKIVWTPEEDEELRRLVDIYGDQSWHRLCKFMPNKTEIRCFKRWLYLKEIDQTVPLSKRKCDSIDSPESFGINIHIQEEEPKSSSVVPAQTSSCTQWSKEEDMTLREKVEQYGTQNWVIIARFLPGRLGRQCRERWHNVIDPSIVRREWTREEDEFILKMHQQIGSKWSQISKMELLIGRTVSQIKNRFYQNLKGKDISQIKYKSTNSINHQESDHKKCNRSEAKQNKQRWANQHLFEDLSTKDRKRRSENKENDFRYSSNVPLDSQDHSIPQGLNKREFKSLLKDQQKLIGLNPQIQKSQLNINEECQQKICNLLTLNQKGNIEEVLTPNPVPSYIRKIQESLISKTQGLFGESTQSNSPFMLFKQKSAPFVQEPVLRQQQNIQNLNINNFELHKYFSQNKIQLDKILSRVSEEDHGVEHDIEIDDIGQKSISINDQEMKDGSKTSKMSSIQKFDSGNNLNSLMKSNSNSEQLKTKPFVQRLFNASSGEVRNYNEKLHNKINLRNVTSEDKSKNKLDLKSIQIRQFNLEQCEDCQNGHTQSKRSQIEEMSVVKRVCLPVFSQNILDQFNLLDIQSSASKSQLVWYENTSHFSSNGDDKQEGNGGVRITTTVQNKTNVKPGSTLVQRGILHGLTHQIKVDSPKNMANCKNRLPLYPKELRKSQSRGIVSSLVKNKSNNGQNSTCKILNNSQSKQSQSNQSSNADVLLQNLLN